MYTLLFFNYQNDEYKKKDKASLPHFDLRYNSVKACQTKSCVFIAKEKRIVIYEKKQKFE
jgi:hypothetical protein